MRDLQAPGRSPVLATGAMAATSHPLATIAALDAMRDGGTAVDAAVAAAAVLAVAEPHMTGIGGDCFCIHLAPGAERPVAYNGSGRAPRAASAEALAERGFETIDPGSADAVTVPGAVEAWARLAADHGRLGLDRLLAPAIRLAEDGCPVQAVVASVWAAAAPVLRRHEAAAAALLPGGDPPRAGDVVRQPALAGTLRLISSGGAPAFYEGETARDIAGAVAALGGALTEEDLAAHRGEYVEPIHRPYRGAEVFECPPNGQGVVALEMLAVLEGYDLAELDPLGPERLHLECEAGRLAFADRDALLADPDAAEVPVERLISDGYAAELRERISAGRAMPEPRPPAAFPEHRDTVYLCAVDPEGGACSLINSLFHAFGSGILAPRSGVLLQNRGAGFTLARGHPNRLAGGRRPLHTIIPGLALEPGRFVMPFGVMGGDYQPFGHAHVLGNLFDHGLDVQAAIDLPRAFHTHGMLIAESGVPADTRAGLERLGHDVAVAGGPLGGGQAIRVDLERGVLEGGSDQRKDGLAAGW